MIGHRTAHYRAFGWAAARLDDLLNLVPARLAALAIVVAAFLLPGANAADSFRGVMRDAAKHRSPNAGWPEASMAGALDLALAGPRQYEGQLIDDHWMHAQGRTTASPVDIRRGLRLYVVACAVQAAAVAALAAF